MTGPARATFFISTGRCGTQWVYSAFAAAFPGQAVVTHEPILTAYKPRRFLRAGQQLDELLEDPAIASHIAMIRRVLDEGKAYVEAGWPCYPAVPLLVKELGGRVNLVHLVRDPVATALSLATHAVYDRNDWIAEGAISPHDPGVVQRELAPLWNGMTMYEKCLFWWTEINLYGMDLQREFPDVPFLRVKYEALFAADDVTALRSVVTHCGLPFVDNLAGARTQRVDGYQQTGVRTDWSLIHRYPRTLALAKELGYSLDGAVVAGNADRRYGTDPGERRTSRRQKLRAAMRDIVRRFKPRDPTQ
jgi:hypothetical protein